MKTFNSSVTDLRRRFSGEFDTFPYECGWADEAIFFVTVEDEAAAATTVELRVQLSSDGIRWLDEGSTLKLTGPSSGFVRVAHFAGYLRLAGVLSSGEAVLTVRLALKG
jgi:hypothetical protein